MASIDNHMKDCHYYLGKDYEKVHAFLDQYARDFPVVVFLDYHRSFLHNDYGLKIVRSRWGEKAYIAGLIHLFRDYLEGPIIHLSLETLLKRIKRYMIYFNKIDVSEVYIEPHIIRGWKGESLCSIAFKKETNNV